jgi:hypothetical protein
MRFLPQGEFFMRILLAMIISFTAVSTASADQTSASMTIDGKTYTLTHSRAWKTGVSMGIPDIEIYFAEKDLAGMNWVEGYKNFENGQRGVALRLAPRSTDKAGAKEPYHYTLDKDTFVYAIAENCHHWNDAVIDIGDGLKVSEMSVSKNMVSGRVDWHGNFECPMSDHAVTAWSAQFNIPLEALPKN